MNITVVTPADTLPCTIDLALRHLKVLSDDVDLLDFYCRAAMAAVEEYTGRIFVLTTFKATLADWPDTTRSIGINRPSPAFKRLEGIDLPRSPLVSIESVKYWPDGGGAQVTWAAANYAADVTALPGRLVFADDVNLPSVATRPDAIEIEFIAGHGTLQHEMPMPYLLAMLQFARHLNDNPGVVDESGNVRVMPLGYRELLRSQKVHSRI